MAFGRAAPGITAYVEALAPRRDTVQQCPRLKKPKESNSNYVSVFNRRDSYKTLQTKLGFDTVILVDGGVDAILRGDEKHIGTPVEDMSSISAVSQLEVERRFVVCLGFGAETDVSHLHALETIATLIADRAFLGAVSLTAERPEVKRYMEATEYVFDEMPTFNSNPLI